MSSELRREIERLLSGAAVQRRWRRPLPADDVSSEVDGDVAGDVGWVHDPLCCLFCGLGLPSVEPMTVGPMCKFVN